jgi:hypothetical protein
MNFLITFKSNGSGTIVSTISLRMQKKWEFSVCDLHHAVVWHRVMNLNSLPQICHLQTYKHENLVHRRDHRVIGLEYHRGARSELAHAAIILLCEKWMHVGRRELFESFCAGGAHSAPTAPPPATRRRSLRESEYNKINLVACNQQKGASSNIYSMFIWSSS